MHARLSAGPAVGNITVTCSGCDASATTLTLARVLFGEVYICSGQSNMELSLEATFSWHRDYEANDTWSLSNGVQINNDTAYPIRVLQVAHNMQLQENVSWGGGEWMVPDYENLKPFSATCWYFGRAMYNLQPPQSKTPIGLIEASWGGTIIEVRARLPATSMCVCVCVS